MKEGCPFKYVKRVPDYQSTAPSDQLVKVISEEILFNGYGNKYHCACPVCGKEFIVQANHNPYYEAWTWPEKTPCE